MTRILGCPNMQLMDINKLTNEILEAGITQAKIAELIPCSTATISDIASGKQKLTNQIIFTGLLKLHSELCNKTQADELS